jgi:GNAT superfamily N-acetyltransferase
MVGVIFGRALNKFNKMLKKVRKEKKSNLNNMLNINDLISSNFTTKSWSDCTPFIAKSLFVAVEEGYRGKKIASRLIQYSNKILAELGVKRVDSKILIDNISAIRLNHRLGYNIYKKGTSLFSTKDL